MDEVLLHIDGKEVRAQKGMTILEAARSVGISIPTLCHDQKLQPYAACRICTVEVDGGTRSTLAAACYYPVEPNLVVRTRSAKVDKTRRIILEELLAHAPDSVDLQNLAKEYGAKRDRFDKEASFCILCGLCVRYCAEVKGANALGFVDRGAKREICFVPEIASSECWNCKECFPLCPTSALQAAYVLMEAMVAPSSRRAKKTSS
jgi:bidirectional [NiFe] hydrogenase diaphorase subunit